MAALSKQLTGLRLRLHLMTTEARAEHPHETLDDLRMIQHLRIGYDAIRSRWDR